MSASDPTPNPYAAPQAGPSFEDLTFGSDKRGVGGWLLAFCLVLTVLSPLLTAWQIVSTYERTARWWELLDGLSTVFCIDASVTAGLTVFGIVAGIAMWSVRPRAVALAKTYLLAQLGWAVISGALPFVLISELREPLTTGFIGGWVYVGGRGLLFTSVWMAYLTRSRRVALTYGLPLPDDGA